LKQLGRQWYQKLTSIFTSLGFKWCSVDEAVFFKVDTHKGDLTITAVHVDDCTIAATCIRLIEELKAGLHQHIEVTDLGELHWMLGIEIKHNREAGTIHLSQRAYIDMILHRYNFADLKPLLTPMDVQVRLSSEQAPTSTTECAIMHDMPYCEAVGALNWAVLTPLYTHASESYVLIGHESALFHVLHVFPRSLIHFLVFCLTTDTCLIVFQIMWYSLCSIKGRFGISRRLPCTI
jgi:Reverse transcriptase (RNA-dependent DNA polymerase)